MTSLAEWLERIERLHARPIDLGLDRVRAVADRLALRLPGVKFVVADKGHNSESVKGMLPEGAEPWKGKINEELTVTFDVEGIYGYKCTPHFAMGMVGLIQVGEGTANLESAKTAKLPGKAKSRMAELTAQANGTEAGGT